MVKAAVLALALLLAACSDDEPDVPALENVDTGPRAEAMDAYNAAIDEWNALVDAGRSDGYASYEEWARDNGKPLEPPR